MQSVINVLKVVFMLFCSMILVVFLAHLLSFFFGYGWKLSIQQKNLSMFFGVTLGVIISVAYFIDQNWKEDDWD